MPVLIEKRTIHTKVRDMADNCQSILLDMYNNPENVKQIYVKQSEDTGKLHVTVIYEENYGELRKNPLPESRSCYLGTIKDEYREYIGDRRITVNQWRITGGQTLEGYNGKCTYFGLNITLYF